MKPTIKQFLIGAAIVATYHISYAQTPYDDFAPGNKKKEMLKLPETTFKAYNSDTTGKIKYIELDKETFALSYYDGNDSVLMQVFLKPTDFKWLSMDPMASSTPHESPYMFCGGNPIFYKDIDGNYKFPTIEEYQAAGLSPQDVVRFESVITNIQNLVVNNPNAMNALINGTGLTSEQILFDMTPGQGPKINVSDMNGAQANQDNSFTIGSNIIRSLASIDENNKKQLGEQTLGVGLLILDEYTHVGDKRTNNGNSSGGYTLNTNGSVNWDYTKYGWYNQIKFGQQKPWSVSPTGHRGGDTQIFGFGLNQSVYIDGSMQIENASQSDVHIKLKGTESIPKGKVDYTNGLDLLN